MKEVTDYSVNKFNKDAIVYLFDGETVVLTKDNFASEEEFQKWKAISDESLREIECNDRNNTRYKSPLEAADTQKNNPGQVDEYFSEEEREKEEQKADALKARVNNAISHCTKVQQKRLWATADGISSYEIAEDEGCSHQSVLESIDAGKKKFRKNF